jgi:predicted Rossmann fold flavoprotein
MIIGIIGAGAAGLIAAATIKEHNPKAQVLLFERNSRIGRKISISGGGRCNVTTGITDIKTVLSKYPRGADFLRKSAFKLFPPKKVVDWFETHGLKLKCEPDMRVFPANDNAEAVNELFEKLIPETFKLSEAVLDIQKTETEQFQITTSKDTYLVDKLILTTGGNAYAHTGSKGDGYNFAKSLGHTVSELGPSLNSFLVLEDWVKELSGLSLEKATLTFNQSQVSGPFIFTHFGISGPVVFAFASEIPFNLIDKDNHLKVRLSFDFTKSDLDELINLNGKKSILNILKQKLPERVCKAILAQNSISPDQKSAEVSSQSRKSLAEGIEITLIARKPGDEFVTAGGIQLDEVNPKTMESKIVPNLYFAGEILNVDGYTGGFNLQASWATGRVSGLSI